MRTTNKKSNATCASCGKSFYRKPSQLRLNRRSFCSVKCMWNLRGIEGGQCLVCGVEVKSHSRARPKKYCSRSCSNKGRRGITYNKDAWGNKSRRHMAEIVNTFGKSCMITECRYTKILEVHRHIPGRNGGKYEIGNMFSLCPNHHAEITRGILEVKKISDRELRPVEGRTDIGVSSGFENRGG